MLVPISPAKCSSDSPSGASSGVIYCATPIRPIATAPAPAEFRTGGLAAGHERHHSSPRQQPAPSQQSVSVITSSAIRATTIYDAPVAAGISNSSGGGHSSSGHGTSPANVHAQLQQQNGTARISTSPGQAQHHHYQLSPLHQYYSPHSARGNLSSRSRSGATPVQNTTPMKRSPSNQTHQQSHHHHHHNNHSAPTAAATNASISADTTSSELHQHNQQLQQQIKDLSDQLSALQAHTSTLKAEGES